MFQKEILLLGNNEVFFNQWSLEFPSFKTPRVKQAIGLLQIPADDQSQRMTIIRAFLKNRYAARRRNCLF